MPSRDLYADLPNLSGKSGDIENIRSSGDPSRFFPSARNGSVDAVTGRILNVPCVSVYFNGGQSIPTGANTPLFWDTVDYDNDGMFSSAANTRLTVKTPGIYLLHGAINFSGSTVGYRQGWFDKNGAGAFGYVTTYDMNGFAAANNLICSWQLSLLAGDYVRFNCVQNSGVNPLAVSASTAATRYNGFQACLISTLGSDN